MHCRDLLSARAAEIQTFLKRRFGRKWRHQVLAFTRVSHPERCLALAVKRCSLVRVEDYARRYGFVPADERVPEPAFGAKLARETT